MFCSHVCCVWTAAMLDLTETPTDRQTGNSQAEEDDGGNPSPTSPPVSSAGPPLRPAVTSRHCSSRQTHVGADPTSPLPPPAQRGAGDPPQQPGPSRQGESHLKHILSFCYLKTELFVFGRLSTAVFLRMHLNLPRDERNHCFCDFL